MACVLFHWCLDYLLRISFLHSAQLLLGGIKTHSVELCLLKLATFKNSENVGLTIWDWVAKFRRRLVCSMMLVRLIMLLYISRPFFSEYIVTDFTLRVTLCSPFQNLFHSNRISWQAKFRKKFTATSDWRIYTLTTMHWPVLLVAMLKSWLTSEYLFWKQIFWRGQFRMFFRIWKI